MKLSVFSFILCFLLSWSHQVSANDVIFKGRAGTALNGLTLYSDSTFTKPTFAGFSAGQLVEILQESELEHEDDAQNQTFKWYRVRGADGKEGWVFGDGLAVIIPEEQLEKPLLPFYKKKMEFNTGFENAIVWMAAIQGHDNFHANTLLNPLYYEAYIVVTNQRGKSVHIHYGGESTQGVSGLDEIAFQELTGDEAPELILLRRNESGRDNRITRELELYSFQSGTMRKVFSERLNLSEEEVVDAPSPYKFLELDKGTIRVEYIDLKSCKDYSLSLRTGVSGDFTGHCLEYVTYTYHWNKRLKKYQLLYEENRSAPEVQIKNPGVFLQEAPNAAAPRLRSIHPFEHLDVIRQHDQWTTERGKQIKETYFYVRLKDGLYGYVPVRFTHFSNTNIASQLDQFYRRSISTTDAHVSNFFSIRTTKADSSAFNH